MSKKNTALILGLAGLGALLYFSKSGTWGAGNGGGLLPENNSEVTPGIIPGGSPYDVVSVVENALQNPWNSALEISNYSGFEGSPTDKKLAESGYIIGSYESYLAQYPKSKISAEDYYSRAGAYELAAITNPEYAFGAQQSRIALGSGKITGEEYQTLKKQGFVNEQGQAVQPAGGKAVTTLKNQTQITTVRGNVSAVSGTTPSGVAYSWTRPAGW